MTRAIKLLAALIIPSILVWLSLGFVFWNWSPETWSGAQRGTLVWFSLMATIPAVGFFGGTA